MKTIPESFSDTATPKTRLEDYNTKQYLRETWDEILVSLPKNIKKSSIETWLRPCSLSQINDNEIVISTKNEFSRKLISQSYGEAIHKASKEVLAASRNVRFTCAITEADIEGSAKQEIANTSKDKQAKSSAAPDIRQKSFAELRPEEIKQSRSLVEANGISNRLRFDNFINCKSNIGAVSFSKAIIENQLGSYYNSLFITSDTGLGKTHLLHATANEALKVDPLAKVRYIKAEDYVNEFVISIKNKSYENFKKKFRNVDLLLLDEAQYLDGKKSTQQEFCSNFDAVINHGGKVIIASSKGIDEFTKLEKKLKSRFQGSLIAEINPVDYQARIAVIESKIQDANLNISSGHKLALAEKFTGNIRELEGALLRLSALNNFSDLEILEIDNKTISDMFGTVYTDESSKGLSINKIARLIAEKFELSIEDLQSSKRNQSIASARHIAIYLSNELLGISYQRIGEFFGGRKHSSVIYSIKTVNDQLNSKLSKAKDLKKLLDEIRSSLRE